MKKLLFFLLFLLSFNVIEGYTNSAAAQIGQYSGQYTRVSDTYRVRERHPYTGAPNRVHKGEDFAAPVGTPKPVTHNGTVTFSGTQRGGGGYGNYMIVTSDSRFYQTVYSHNSSNNFPAGTRVTEGQIIAKVGSTGDSTGPHVHYETRVMDRNGEYFAVDPALVREFEAQGKNLDDPAVRDDLQL